MKEIAKAASLPATQICPKHGYGEYINILVLNFTVLYSIVLCCIDMYYILSH